MYDTWKKPLLYIIRVYNYNIDVYISNYNTNVCMTRGQGSSDLGLHVVEPSGNKRRLQIEITFILTVCCSSQRVSCQLVVVELILNSTTKPVRRRLDRTKLLLFLMAGDIHPNPGPTAKYPCQVSLPCMCPRPH